MLLEVVVEGVKILNFECRLELSGSSMSSVTETWLLKPL